jgi:hypothetical protein
MAVSMDGTGGLSRASGRNVDRLKSSGFAEDRGQGVTNLKVRLPFGKKAILKMLLPRTRRSTRTSTRLGSVPSIRTRRRPRSRYITLSE